MMHLIDIREPDGPYGAAYQATRARDGITDNPDMVPDWFVAKLARERVAAARVAMEQLTSKATAPEHDERATVWAALRTIELFIREGHTLDPAVEQVVAGLLGAQEIATERERRDVEGYGSRTVRVSTAREAALALAEQWEREAERMRATRDGADRRRAQVKQRAAEQLRAAMAAATDHPAQDGRIR